jgi:aldehyde:ferredoxin oxidoreductase
MDAAQDRLRAVEFLDAAPYVGLDNLDMAAAIERDFHCTEREDMALARITTAGENQVLCSGIMGGIKAIWARGGGGAKMGALKLKAIMVHGKPPRLQPVQPMAKYNKVIGKKITSTSVIKNALKHGRHALPLQAQRVLGALGTKNNQTTAWHESLDADNFDPYRPGMDGCYKCPVHCRNQNDMTPEGKGGWGAAALMGLKGNASYDKAQADIDHHKRRTYNGIKGDGKVRQVRQGRRPRVRHGRQVRPDDRPARSRSRCCA